MDIRKLFDQKRCVFSFEVFPPKTDSSADTVCGVLSPLAALAPDYISVTYGAGGTGGNLKTQDICRIIKNRYGIEPLMHLTCLESRAAEIAELLAGLRADGIDNILALRGDRRETPAASDFRYASDLVSFIKAYGGFNIVGACYPEGHFECDGKKRDIFNLKKKVEAGVTHLNSQLFFDDEDFFDFKERARAAGIDVPIQAGIMPIVRDRQIDRIIALAGVKIPQKLSRLIAKYGGKPNALFDAGIAYATEQISDLIAGGADGVHLYVMNRPDVAERITNNIHTLLRIGHDN
ncbi:MAG: methylenetetrahydrofolate reductase [Clostridiales bacterium]|jgi:methylenetetrahydrofolate reductase (NADPH)|nr:methylenetetrahydrofolate reductase [Clostridiales bacterium]